jgi:hypothetical protein
MIPPRLRVLLALLPLVGMGWLCLALMDLRGGGKLREYVFYGYWYGTLFGHTSVAAAWAALGPSPWYVRLPLAVTWLAGLLVAVAITLARHGGSYGETIALFAALLLGQWLLMQVPLWALAWTYRLEMQHRNDMVPADQRSGRLALQFGIRQLMTLVLVVAIVLGILRAVTLWAVDYGDRGGGDLISFIYLAVAACIMSLPLMMAALLPRRAVAATLGVLVLSALATVWELPLLRLFPIAAGTDPWHFVFMNGFLVVWVLALIGAVRLNGYGLAGRHDRPVTE